MNEEKEYIIKNHNLEVGIDLTKSVLQDVANYLNKFDCNDTLPKDEQIKRYQELITILKDTVSAYNDEYALLKNSGNVHTEPILEWDLPRSPKDKANYIAQNLSTFIKKYEFNIKANKDLKPGQKPTIYGFTTDGLKKFLKDYEEINNVLSTAKTELKDAYKSIFIKGLSYQEFADQYLGGKKHQSTYAVSQIKDILERHYIDKENAPLKELKEEKSKENGIRIKNLYEQADANAFQKMIESGGDIDRYYDYYKEECLKVDRMLEEEENNKPYADQVRIVKLNKEHGKKDWKSIDFDKGGKITHSTSEIQDISGDEEYLNNKIFKKKK